MSADYETRHYKAYYHHDKGYFAVFEKSDDEVLLGHFSPEDVAELAEIAADFSADEDES
jgi:hypothetical protein